MAGPARGAVRSSARLSTGGGNVAGDASAQAAAQVAAQRSARSAEAAAEAARRRARAAERAREVEDSPRVLRDKCRRLARALRNAKHLVVYTGAGISTAADIPDYRGPRGVWTRLQRGEAVGRVEVSRAQPTLTHMALTALWERGLLKFVVSQNCDGLHLRAGLPRRALAELHGNMFAERCAACRRVYLRAFDTTERTARHAHATRRLCHACGAELADTIVHFGERGRAAWPLNWAGALRHAAAADVVLCLGSSLKVLRRYPRLWRMQSAPHARPALYIVNLQWTPKDAVAALKINARCDAVMAQVARRLRLRVPRYSARRDPLLAHAVPLATPEAHTTRRPLLAAPPPAPPPAPLRPPCAAASDDSDSSASSWGCDSELSPSASDSDEELPLRRLAERMRAPRSLPPPPPPPPPPLPPPPPDLLHAFQVSMRSGDATILLRADHAPSAAAPLPPRAAAAPAHPAAPAAPRRPLSDLRMFRFARHAPPAPLTNGSLVPLPHPAPPPAPLNGHAICAPPNGRVVSPFMLDDEEKPKKQEKIDFKSEVGIENFNFFKALDETVVKTELADYESDEKSKSAAVAAAEADAEEEAGAGEASALAAAIIARAVLLCRASLYPGLHTILAPGGGGGARSGGGGGGGGGAECAWCSRRFAARRCRWYGPPPAPHEALEARVWRRVRARRYLCACCGERDEEPRRDDDGGGWYGKGYRKGRRRRR